MKAWWLGCVLAVAACGREGVDPAAGGSEPAPTGTDTAITPTPTPTPPLSPWEPLPVNAPDGPLCDLPDDYVATGGDPVDIPCSIAADRFTDRDPDDVPPRLKVVAWNVQYGKESATVAAALAEVAAVAEADLLLLTEVPRRASDSDPAGIDLARDLAQALAMDYAFAVEWDWRLHPEKEGEHGTAVLSKYPLGNATLVRHTPAYDWYAEDDRFGGRMSLGVDLLAGGRRIRVYASHLCTRGSGDLGRAAQAAEIRADADRPGHPPAQVIGGDFNTWTCNPGLADCTHPPDAEAAVEEMLAADWLDGTAGFNGHTQLGAGFFPQRLDWLFYRGLAAEPGSSAPEAHGSDHLPVVFEIEPPR